MRSRRKSNERVQHTYSVRSIIAIIIRWESEWCVCARIYTVCTMGMFEMNINNNKMGKKKRNKPSTYVFDAIRFDCLCLFCARLLAHAFSLWCVCVCIIYSQYISRVRCLCVCAKTRDVSTFCFSLEKQSEKQQQQQTQKQRTHRVTRGEVTHQKRNLNYNGCLVCVHYCGSCSRTCFHSVFLPRSHALAWHVCVYWM